MPMIFKGTILNDMIPHFRKCTATNARLISTFPLRIPGFNIRQGGVEVWWLRDQTEIVSLHSIVNWNLIVFVSYLTCLEIEEKSL